MRYKKGILLNNFLLHPQFFQILQIAALWNVCVTETLHFVKTHQFWDKIDL